MPPRLTPRQMYRRAVDEIGPVPGGVYFRRRRMPWCGYTSPRASGGFWIVLASSLFGSRRNDYRVLQDTVIHEIAHAYIWNQTDKDEPHSPVWGAMYARVYQAVSRES